MRNKTVNNNNEKFYIAPQKLKSSEAQIIANRQDARVMTRATRVLRQVAEVFPPAMHGIILIDHRVIDIATNTSMVLNCALVTYLMMIAELGLLDDTA